MIKLYFFCQVSEGLWSWGRHSAALLVLLEKRSKGLFYLKIVPQRPQGPSKKPKQRMKIVLLNKVQNRICFVWENGQNKYKNKIRIRQMTDVKVRPKQVSKWNTNDTKKRTKIQSCKIEWKGQSKPKTEPFLSYFCHFLAIFQFFQAVLKLFQAVQRFQKEPKPFKTVQNFNKSTINGPNIGKLSFI